MLRVMLSSAPALVAVLFQFVSLSAWAADQSLLPRVSPQSVLRIGFQPAVHSAATFYEQPPDSLHRFYRQSVDLGYEDYAHYYFALFEKPSGYYQPMVALEGTITATRVNGHDLGAVASIAAERGYVWEVGYSVVNYGMTAMNLVEIEDAGKTWIALHWTVGPCVHYVSTDIRVVASDWAVVGMYGFKRSVAAHAPVQYPSSRPYEFGSAGGTPPRLKILPNGFVGIGTSTPNSRLTVGSMAPTSPLISTSTFWVAGSEANPAGVSDSGSVVAVFTGGGLYAMNHADGGDVAAMIFRGADAAGSKSRLLFVGDNSVKNSSVYNIVDVQGQSGHLAFDTAASSGALAERMRITSSGNVGIGTPTPSTKVHVVGDSTFDGNATFSGTVYGGNIQAKFQDIAEWVPTTEHLSAGTVVVLDRTATNHVRASTRAYDAAVAGVVSEQPGLILGEAGEAKAMIATTGRVRVKVDATRGPIEIGDLLVTSDRAGIAMRSLPIDLGGIPIHRPGTLIGKALEPLASGEGEILVLLSLQ